MRKALRILTSPIVLAIGICGYWMLLILLAIILIGSIAEYLADGDDPEWKMIGYLLIYPLILTWKWIDNPKSIEC